MSPSGKEPSAPERPGSSNEADPDSAQASAPISEGPGSTSAPGSATASASGNGGAATATNETGREAALASAAVPGPDSAPAPRRYGWAEIRAIAGQHRRDLVVGNAMAILAALLAVPVPLLMPLLVDEIILHRPGPLVPAMAALLPSALFPGAASGAEPGPVAYILLALIATAGLRIFAFVLGIWQVRRFSYIAKDVTYQIRRDLLDKLGRVAMAEYEAMGSGATASRLVVDLNTVDEFVGASISRFLLACFALVGTSVVLFWMHWPLALFILFANPLVIYATVRLSKRVKALKKEENSALEAFQGALTETLEAIQQIRAAGREVHYLGRLTLLAREIRTHAARFAWRSEAVNKLSFVVFLVAIDGFRALSIAMVLLSDLSVGQMMAIFGYLWFMMAPVQEIVNLKYSHAAADAALERVNQLFALPEEPRHAARQDPFAGQRTVGLALVGVTFRYGDGPPILEDVDLDIQPGEKVAVVGASGAGKSTLVQILLGLYTPQRGEVCYGGVTLREIGVDRVRAEVAVVLQSPAIFNDSVRGNLTLGRSLPEAALWEALAVAQLAERVQALPQGLETMVGRQGVRLSGGERQRLAIARMVLAAPQVVILDEATSALDTETEARLHEALAGFLAGRTTVIIAHRLRAVRRADRVVVFDGGRIAEEGAHDTLVQADGIYRRLYA